EGGFTLVELMVVLVVIGILAGIVLFGVGAFRSDARNSACRTDVRTLQTANAAYLARTGTNAHDIAALVSGGYIHSAPESGVTFADGATNPASMDACTGELAFTPDPPSSVPSPATMVISFVDGSTIRHDDISPWTATVTVVVTDQAGTSVPGAVVTGAWDDGASGSGCTTGPSGGCSFDSSHTQSSPSDPVTWHLGTATKDGATLNAASTASVVCKRPSAVDKDRTCDPTVTA
ncbi:MAG: ral secretion pathway protein, partial [Actinomycetota bacterium]|nr:ral secretion pathway protein [Actinomycetota bacterium]